MISFKRLFLIMITSFFFIILNLFLYTLITISIYKWICYENNYINNLIDVTFSQKESIVIFFTTIRHKFFFIGIKWYKIIINSFFFFNNFNFFFTIVYNIKINFFFYMNSFIIITKKHLNLIFLNFYIRSSNLNWINSISLQKTIILNYNESGLFFFRIYNPSHLNVKLITLYMIYPSIITLYINKIQCFCFNVIFLYSLELVDLPVLIYINPFFSILDLLYINNILIYYIIFLN